MGVVEQVQDVIFSALKEVFEADDIAAPVQQTLAQMRAEHSGSASDQRSGAVGVAFQTINP